MRLTRRELSLLMPALAATAAAQEEPAKQALPAKVYKYSDLPVKQNGKNQTRAVLDGLTHLKDPVEVHITQLGPGEQPHGPHSHAHEEMVMLSKGELDVTISGKTTRIGPGSVGYVASGLVHGWKNPGTEPAEYFVVALGPRSASTPAKA